MFIFSYPFLVILFILLVLISHICMIYSTFISIFLVISSFITIKNIIQIFISSESLGFILLKCLSFDDVAEIFIRILS